MNISFFEKTMRTWRALKPGDTVAVLSPSAGLPHAFPWVYENGLRVFQKWNLTVKEYPTTRKSSEYLRLHPRERARDFNRAFSDKKISAVFSSIGGIDSIRILPYLDEKIIKKNPKPFMGYSDATPLHIFLNSIGIPSLYGPSIMAGFSQMNSLSETFEQHVRSFLFGRLQDVRLGNPYFYAPYSEYSEGYPNWQKKQNTGKVQNIQQNSGWNILQGEVPATGVLWGGCLESLEQIRGTRWWPKNSFWKNKILFIETSEEKPPLHFIDHELRCFGMMGMFSQLSALLVGRARDYSPTEKKQLDALILRIVSGEFGHKDLAIASNMDFGHTDPQWVLPYGFSATLDPKKHTFSLTSS